MPDLLLKAQNHNDVLAQLADFDGRLDAHERFNPSHTWTHLFANPLDAAELWACCVGLVNKELRRARNLSYPYEEFHRTFICICFCAIIVTQMFLKFF